MSVIPMISAASGILETPDLWAKRLPAKYMEWCPRLVCGPQGMVWTAGNQATAPLDLEVLMPHGTSAESHADMSWLASAEGRLYLQQRDQVAGEVLYATGELWDLIKATEDDAFILACYRAYNEWLAELCATNPERFIGLAKIPVTGADDATAELKRAIETLGLKGAILDAWPGGPECPPAVGECEGFWEAAAALKAPLSLYRPLNGDREPAYSIAPGNAPEFYQDMSTIIYSNIPDRHPDIRFVSAAANVGWAPPSFEALNESYMRASALRKVNLDNPDLLPADYLRRFFTFITQDDRTALANADYFGDAHLMWGSFAFMGADSYWPNTRQLFERTTSGYAPEFKKRLAHDVVARFYAVAGAKPFSQAELTAYQNYALL